MKNMRDLSRRTILTGAAVAVPAAAVASVPALAAPEADAELIALGERLEVLLRRYFDAKADWAPRVCAFNRELRARGLWAHKSGEDRAYAEAREEACDEISRTTGLDKACAALNAASGAIESLKEELWNMEAETIDGLRAKALMVVFEASPLCGGDLSVWNWPDDGGATYSLVWDVAAKTRLLPLLNLYEDKFEKIAEEIEAAGGDGSEQEEAERAAKEPPKPWTPEEHLASYRRLIDHCTAKIAELEAAGVTGASHV
ncbi:MAG: hypothetical protein U1E81_08195 [Xanthobacteraceae bacterium]